MENALISKITAHTQQKNKIEITQWRTNLKILYE